MLHLKPRKPADADADVRLHAHSTPLAHVHPDRIFQQVVYIVRRGGGDVEAVHDRYYPGAFAKSHRKPRSGDGSGFQGVARFLAVDGRGQEAGSTG